MYLIQIFGFYLFTLQSASAGKTSSQRRTPAHIASPVGVVLLPLYGQSSRENFCLLQAAPHGSHRTAVATMDENFRFKSDTPKLLVFFTQAKLGKVLNLDF